MLPFLKSKQSRSAGIITAVRKPEGGMEESPDEKPQEDHGLKSCAAAIISAIESKNSDALAQALQEAFEIMGSKPSSEEQQS